MPTYAELYASEIAHAGPYQLPQEWTPSNWRNSNPNDNDCALGQSWFLYGDQRYYVVSQFADNLPHTTAKVGALACYRWAGSNNNFDHIGLVVGIASATEIYSLEFNTSGPTQGDHVVAVKLRPMSEVVCYVQPSYTQSAPPPPTTKPITPAERIRKGML